MRVISIGDAARAVGLTPSALRYYEQRGLIRPATRHGGRRVYDDTDLRRLAFLRLVHQLGLSLDAAASMTDMPGEHWRKAAETEMVRLEQLIARARGAQAFLRHAIACPHEHPVTECPDLVLTLDQLLAGRPIEEIAEEHGSGNAH